MDTNATIGWAATYNPEDLILHRKVSDGSYTDQNVEYCKRRPATQQELVALVLLKSETIAFYLWTEKLQNGGNGAGPKINDVLEDASDVRWTIKSVVKQGMGERWRCVCLREISR